MNGHSNEPRDLLRFCKKIQVLKFRSSYAKRFKVIKTRNLLEPLVQAQGSQKQEPQSESSRESSDIHKTTLVDSITEVLSTQKLLEFGEKFQIMVRLDNSWLLETVPTIAWNKLEIDLYDKACLILISETRLTNEVFICFLKELVLPQLLKEGPLNRGLDISISAIIVSRPQASLVGLILPLLASTCMDKAKADMMSVIIANNFGTSLHDELLRKIFSHIGQASMPFSEPIIMIIQNSLKLVDHQSISIDTVDIITSVLATESTKQPRSLAVANLFLTFITKAKEKIEVKNKAILIEAIGKNKSSLKRVILKELSKVN